VTAPPEPAEPTPAPGWRAAFLSALGVWAVAQAAHWLIGFLSTLAPGGGLPDGVVHAWYQWDTVWFTRIAPAFFPLYPLLMAPFRGHAFLGGLIVANLAFYAALVLMHRFVATETEEGTATRTLWYLVAFPTGFFLAAAYNTALFLALTVGSVYALRRQRWWLAGLLAALATATRSSGLLLLVPMVYEYVRLHGRRVRPQVLSLALVPAGLVGFMLYTWLALDDGLAFLHAQSHWSRQLDWPWSALGREISMIARQPKLFNDTGAHNLIDLAAVLLAAVLVTLCFVGPWRLRRDQYAIGVYGAVLVLFMIIFPNTGTRTPYPLQSSARFILEVFPAYLVLGRIGIRPLLDRGYLVLAMGVQAVLLDHFLHAGWVA
jgi:Gpi18-like mannosyltransferase